MAQVEVAQYRYGPQLVIPMPATVVADLATGDIVDLGLHAGITLQPYTVATKDPNAGLAIMGVFSVKKAVGITINVDDTVLYDKTNKVAYVTGGGYSDDLALGMCVELSASTATEVNVFVHPFSHTAAG